MDYTSRPAVNQSVMNASERPVSGGVPAGKSVRPDAGGVGEKLAAEMEVFEKVARELRSKMSCGGSCEERAKRVTQVAAELFGVAPTWVAFFREVMAREGVIATLYPDLEEKRTFEQTGEFLQVLEMLTALRSRDLPENDGTEVQRMITVRIPKCVHDYICDEANALQVSVNKLCISRLLQKSDERMIPTSSQKRRGRKPGAGPKVSPTVVESDPGLMG